MLIDQLIFLQNELEQELKENILSFWIKHTLDEENGGFYGYISNNLVKDKTHDKGIVLYARILWTFSKAYGMYKDEKYLNMANIAFEYILEHFCDKEFLGVYWMLDYKGNISISKKQTYAQAFTIYGFTEYYRATGKKESLLKAIELYEVIEKYCYDPIYKGYIDALSVDWKELSDRSLSDKDMNVAKTMNTNLHVMEAYTNLLSVWKDDNLRNSLKALISTTIEYIVDKKTYHFRLYFDENWDSKSDIISFGHDIEGSWLIFEAAEMIEDKEFTKVVRDVALKMAQSVYKEGIDFKHGGIFNELDDDKVLHAEKVWWPQAEAVVGFFNAYQLTCNSEFLQVSLDTWQFIKNNVIDKVNGEWLWDTSYYDAKYAHEEKVGPWKCPYHNSRMCLEIISRINKMKVAKQEDL